MGGVPSLPTEEITKIANETVTAFAPAYAKAYALALVKDIKEKRDAPLGHYYLAKPPLPSAPLKEGYLVKQGGAVKNWKKRWFVVTNAADNYEVRYYTDEAAYKAAPDKPKGTICLCWYRIEITDHIEAAAATSPREGASESKGDEPKSPKPAGDTTTTTVVAKPWWSSDRRRTWYMRPEDPAEAGKWKDVLELAAWRAGPPLSKDRVAAEAFKAAYRATRWALGEWGWYYYGTSEQEMLGLLISDRCERTCMGEVYAKIPSNMASIIRPRLQTALDATVGAVVAGAWKTASTSIAAAAPTLKAKAEEQLGPIFDAQANIKNKITDAISAKLNPVAKKAADLIVPNVTAALLHYLVAADTLALTAFANEMNKLVAGSNEAFQGGIDSFRRECNYYWGPLYDAVAELRNLYYRKPTTSAGAGALKLSVSLDTVLESLGGVDAWDMSRMFEDDLRALTSRAAFTFGKEVADAPGTPKAAILARVTALFIHDLKMAAYERIHKVFNDALAKPINKDVVPTIQDALTPIKSLIPDALADFIDIDGTIEDIIGSVIDSLVDASFLPAARERLAALDGQLRLTPGDAAVPDFEATLTSGAPHSK